MRGKNAATPKGTQRKSHPGSPGPSKTKDSTAKCGTQKGQGAADKKKVDMHVSCKCVYCLGADTVNTINNTVNNATLMITKVTKVHIFGS